ncbi:transglutaminase domain-containing protein [Candidatus Woesearchaeota archaeon]|nr:transglutaminase domain-containing protein [Candidatus Woesearchaeota archaeon]
MRKKAFVFFVLILFCIAVASAQLEDVFYTDSLLLDVDLESDFSLTGSGKIDFVKADFQFYPVDSFHQEVLETATQPKATEKDESLEFLWENPLPGTFTYTVSSKVRTYNRFMRVKEKIPFPLKITDPSLKQYMVATEKIDINADIIAKANEIAQGEDDLYRVVFNLATWTKQNINYSLDSTTADASQKASWVLTNRYGVCDEITNLFIAMARSLGIPARFVSGISYSNSPLFEDSWGLHGWAEVYFPDYGWVSFDPTYGQFGQIDATHIKLRDSPDSDKSSTKFEWQANNADLKYSPLENSITILEQGSLTHGLVDITVRPLRSKVDFGSYNLIEAKLKNNKDYYVGSEMLLSKPKEVTTIGEEEKYVLLEPNSETSIYWIVKVDDSLKKNFIYTFPIEVYDSLGNSGEDEFKSEDDSYDYSYSEITKLYGQLEEKEEKTYSKNVELECSVSGYVYVNESFDISCRLENKGNVFLNGLNVCLETQCQEEDLGISQSKTLDFKTTIQERGEQELKITASNKDVNTFYLLSIIANDMPVISIENLRHPEILEYGPDFEVSFELFKRSYSKPVNMTVIFRFNNRETEWKIDELESNQIFNVQLNKDILDPKGNNFEVKVLFHDSNSLEFEETYKKELEIVPPDFFTRIMMWLNKVSREIENMLDGLNRE